MLSQYVESLLLILDAGYTEKLPQGKKSCLVLAE